MDIIYQAYRTELLSVKYPFADAATLRTRDGILMDQDTFLDFSLYPIGGLEQLYLSKVVVEANLVTLWVGDTIKSELCYCSFDPLFPPDVLEFLDSFGRPAGVAVSSSERLAVFQTWPIGTHPFSPSATPFVATACVSMPEEGVRGISVNGEVLSGDVWLVGENGVVLSEEDGCIRVDVVGDPLFKRAANMEDFETPRFITSINGVSPDDGGDIKLTVGRGYVNDPVIRIYPNGKGLTVAVVGSKQGG